MAANYLIDSHIFFWAIDAPENLSAAERHILDDSSVDVAVSVASFWELSIKLAKGMLRLRPGKSAIGRDYFIRQAGIAGLAVLSIDPPEAEYVRVLPRIHGDPFDRVGGVQTNVGVGGLTRCNRSVHVRYNPPISCARRLVDRVAHLRTEAMDSSNNSRRSLMLGVG